MTESEYRAHDAVNFSRLKLMDRSPLHYRDFQRKDTSRLQLGRLVHALTLEPHREKFAVWSGGVRRGKRWDEFVASSAEAGLETVTAAEMDQAKAMVSSLHPRLSGLLAGNSGYHTEVNILWGYNGGKGGLECKSRLDLAAPGRCLVDLKTTADARPGEFGRSAARYHYHAQAAFYQQAWYAATDESLPFFFAVVETEAPYDSAVYEITGDQLEAGWDLCTDWMDRVVECRKRDEWPGVCPDVQALDLPHWAMGPALELSIGGQTVEVTP